MNSEIFYFLLLVGLVFLSSCTQIVLKKAADKHYENKWQEYVNFPVLFAYFLFFSIALATVFLVKYVSMSYFTISQMTAYVFVAVMSRIFLKEKISLKKAGALLLIIAGIVIFIL